MLSISHALTGAFIATKIQQPLVYIPLAFSVHFFEDWIPHWDAGTGLGTGKRTRFQAFIYGSVDLAIAGVLILLFWGFGDFTTLIHAMIGGFACLLPDFMEAPKVFLKIKIPGLKPLSHLHEKFHCSVPNIWIGLTPQLILWGLIWWLR